jgi:hypothetical protein
MKFSIKLLLPAVMLVGCTKNIDSYNEETKKPAKVPAATIFSNSVKSLADGLANASVNVNVFRFTIKHWSMATYQDEVQYDFTTRAIPDAWWARMYRDVLNDLQDAAKVTEETVAVDDEVKANQLAVIDLMQVYTYSILVNTFGNVPYTLALNDKVLFPTYDDAKTIYADLLARTSSNIGKITSSKSGFSATQDFIGGGNMNLWLKFAHSLRIKLAMTIADVDNATAKSAIESSASFALSNNSDKIQIAYPNEATPNPLYSDIVLGGRNDYLASVDLMTPLISMEDPRKAQFFGTNNAGDFVGGIVGAGNVTSEVSKPSSKVSDARAPYVYMDNIETEFFLAEAIERGYNVGGTAAEHYAKAIKASIIAWGGTEAEADKYVARPDVAYATAKGDWKEKIGFQKWIALYGRPYEGWTEVRRLDYPKLTAVVGAKAEFPNRLTYPANEQQTNGGSYTEAAAAIGGDKLGTKIFWDKF